MRILSSLLISATLLLFAGCSRGPKEGDNYSAVDPNDQAMQQAIEKAKATSAEFVQAFHAKKAGTTDFFVKKPFGTPGGGKEHMWIEVTAEEKGVVKGLVANEAEETREVKMGQPVSLNISEITDWKYQDGKKLVGGYTIRYFINQMSPEERAEFLKQAGFEL
jgi:uncharacterized protein YegJ (DUF2314 family)